MHSGKAAPALAHHAERVFGFPTLTGNVIEPVGCPLVELGNSSVTLRLRAWCHEPLAASSTSSTSRPSTGSTKPGSRSPTPTRTSS